MTRKRERKNTRSSFRNRLYTIFLHLSDLNREPVRASPRPRRSRCPFLSLTPNTQPARDARWHSHHRRSLFSRPSIGVALRAISLIPGPLRKYESPCHYADYVFRFSSLTGFNSDLLLAESERSLKLTFWLGNVIARNKNRVIWRNVILDSSSFRKRLTDLNRRDGLLHQLCSYTHVFH